MASRIASRFVQRRFSSSGKMLSEEEKAAENVYIKKTEKEKLEKLARKGPTSSEAAAAPEAAASAANPSGPAQSTTAGVSADKNRNYGVLAGTVAAVSVFGWWYFSKPKKEEIVG